MKQSAGPADSVARDQGAANDDTIRAFVEVLLRWSRTINLVGRHEPERLIERHVRDSAQLVNAIPDGTNSIADLGSGAGFPGLVVCILTRCATHLVERDQRKAAFLREAIRVTGAPAIVHVADAATLASLNADLVTARALAPLSGVLPLVARHLAPNGTALLHKGAKAEEELTQVRGRWTMRCERIESITDPAASILRITELQRAG